MHVHEIVHLYLKFLYGSVFFLSQIYVIGLFTEEICVINITYVLIQYEDYSENAATPKCVHNNNIHIMWNSCSDMPYFIDYTFICYIWSKIYILCKMVIIILKGI